MKKQLLLCALLALNGCYVAPPRASVDLGSYGLGAPPNNSYYAGNVDPSYQSYGNNQAWNNPPLAQGWSQQPAWSNQQGGYQPQYQQGGYDIGNSLLAGAAGGLAAGLLARHTHNGWGGRGGGWHHRH